MGSAGESNSNLALPPPSHFSPHRTNRPPHALKILFRFSRALNHPLVGAAPPCALAGFAGQSFPTHRSVGSRHQTGTIFPAECGPVHLLRKPLVILTGIVIPSIWITTTSHLLSKNLSAFLRPTLMPIATGFRLSNLPFFQPETSIVDGGVSKVPPFSRGFYHRFDFRSFKRMFSPPLESPVRAGVL